MLEPDQKIKAKIGNTEYLGHVVKRIPDFEGRRDLYIVNLTVEDKSGFFVARREHEIKKVKYYADEERRSPENQETAKDDGVLA